ncbi:GNAT family N-acetyltransferase [Haliangium ochraceum]|uniref:BioF2-like acetyltransferase domain-containing protein n=1 Tax=Haliangium ochraceum (strain DSM 14365 / JCM 11303 / SMP-2) TaxID=502025 RepID=D0LN50_HALO1|nr:GNAT family N-acetyltransferase [Haliangium ochraceum]ACY15227.1 hypothetical protein Hoch_2697 [Haliangium ochraceum DSM 14365]
MKHVSLITAPHQVPRTAWLELLARTPGSSAELHPDVVAANPQVEDALVYHCYASETLVQLAVLLPKSLSAVGRSQALGVGRLDGFRLVGDQLLGGRDGEAAARFLTKMSLRFARSGGDCLYFEDIDDSTPLWRAIAEIAGRRGWYVQYPRPRQAHWHLRFPEQPSDYWQSKSRKSRYNARRAARLFTHDLRRFTAASEVERFLRDAAYVSERSWQGQRLGLRLHPSEGWRAHLGALARVGALRSYILYHNAQPAAFVYGWQHGGRYAYEEVGFDRALAAQGPGGVLLYRLIEDLIADDCPSEIDFGCGDAEYKRSAGNHQSFSGPAVVAPNNLKTQIWSGLHQTRFGVDRGMREVLRRTGLYERARRAYRRGFDTVSS